MSRKYDLSSLNIATCCILHRVHIRVKLIIEKFTFAFLIFAVYFDSCSYSLCTMNVLRKLKYYVMLCYVKFYCKAAL